MKSNGMFLVLSAKLEPTILNLKDESGKKRQYRMTNRSRDGRKLYFRCSRCDTLAKKADGNIRARLIICNGEVMGDEFPHHHPECEPWTDEQLLVQQIDRSSRKTVKEGLLQPFEAYQDVSFLSWLPICIFYRRLSGSSTNYIRCCKWAKCNRTSQIS